MSLTGPKPKPTRQKIAEGNPGKRKLNMDEPQFCGIPTCPKHLSPLAKKEWRRVMKELLAAGLVTSIDRAALAIYCAAWARWIEADEKAKQAGEVIRTQSGNAIINPFRSVANRAEEIMLRAAAEFGMTPSSRTRLTVKPPEEEELDELLNEPRQRETKEAVN